MSGYIAFEGVEGSGKSTVIRLVAARLESDGDEVVLVREPGGSPLGEGIRDLLLHGPEMIPWAEAQLFAAQRAQLAEEVIRPALARGAWVLGDRSVYSSLAYQGHARGLGIAEVRAVNEAGLGGTWPDRVVLLQTDPEEGLRRQRVADRIGGEGLEFQETVAEGYRLLSEAEPERFLVVPVDGSNPRAVATDVCGMLRA